jgi:hypothetical protein
MMLPRLLLLVLLAALFTSLWPGSWHSPWYLTHSIGWQVSPDRSLKQLALAVRRWRREGRLTDHDRLLTVDPQVIDYFAWFCPEEKLAYEPAGNVLPGGPAPPWQSSRLPDAQRPEERSSKMPADRHWRAVQERSQFTHLLVDDPETMVELLAAPERWLLVDIEGRAAVLAWKGAFPGDSGPTPFAVDRLAFSPDWTNDKELWRVPGQAVEPGQVEARRPGRCKADVPASYESESAASCLRCFHEWALPQDRLRRTGSLMAGAAGLAAIAVPGADCPIVVLTRMGCALDPSVLLDDPEQYLSAWPLLAVRFARIALGHNPNDAHAWLQLGQAYQALWTMAEEPVCGGTCFLVAELRYVQMVTALERAVALDPDCEPAHRLLATIYRQRGHLDSALEHCQQEARLARGAGPGLRERREDYEARLRGSEELAAALQRAVQERRGEFARLSASGLADPRKLAQAALRLGLARQALVDVLVPTPLVLLESDGVQMELQLMLALGRADQMGEQMLDPSWHEHQANLGTLMLPAPALPGYPRLYRLPAYCWLSSLWAAGTGNYDLAEDRLHEALELLRSQQSQRIKRSGRSVSLCLATEIALGAPPAALLPRLVARDAQQVAVQFLSHDLNFAGDQADLYVVGGLLAVERGLPGAPEYYLETALRRGHASGGSEQVFATRRLATGYMRKIRAAAR